MSDLKEQDRYSHIFSLSIFENALFICFSRIIDKNIIKRFVISKDINQIKGLLRFIDNSEFFINESLNYVDSIILDFIIKNRDKLDSKESDYKYILNEIKDFINKESFDNLDSRFIYISNIIKTVKSKAKNSDDIKNRFSLDKNINKSNFLNINLGYDKLENAALYTFNKVLSQNLLYHDLFNYSDFLDYLKKKKLVIKFTIKEHKQLNLF